jgi:hypothetical protein
MRSSIVWILVLGLAGCSAPPNPQSRQARAKTPSTDHTSRFDVMVRQLAALEGQFTPDWEFSGNTTLFRTIGALSDSGSIADSAVTRLADCIAQTEPAHVTYRGKPVALGVVCYAALHHIAYHEETDSTGAITPYWRGDLRSPDATPQQLGVARAAWLEVIQQKSYHTL